MKKIKFYASTDNEGSLCEDIWEYDDDVLESEIEQDFKEWRNGIVDSGWIEIDE